MVADARASHIKLDRLDLVQDTGIYYSSVLAILKSLFLKFSHVSARKAGNVGGCRETLAVGPCSQEVNREGELN